jgi:hypothetical protein
MKLKKEKLELLAFTCSHQELFHLDAHVHVYGNIKLYL